MIWDKISFLYKVDSIVFFNVKDKEILYTHKIFNLFDEKKMIVQSRENNSIYLKKNNPQIKEQINPKNFIY